MGYKLKEWEEQHDNIINGYTTLERVRKIYGDGVADRIQREFDSREERYRNTSISGLVAKYKKMRGY
jgi:hypothetical protein